MVAGGDVEAGGGRRKKLLEEVERRLALNCGDRGRGHVLGPDGRRKAKNGEKEGKSG